jgi:hypothetical protein
LSHVDVAAMNGSSGRSEQRRLSEGHLSFMTKHTANESESRSSETPVGRSLSECTDGGSRWQHPPSFYCPISQQCMHDPVVLSDGHSYERRHIQRWLENHNTSPVSGLQLQRKDFFPNHALRNAIDEYFKQVFSAHRRAIRNTISAPESTLGLSSNVTLLRTIDALMQCSMLVNADLSTECVLRQIMDEAKTLLGAEVASVFLLDSSSQELYSTVNSTGGELRIPVSVGIAGHVATTGEHVVIADAYHDDRFNKTVDVKTGFKTRNMICVPLKTKRGAVIGVVQLINKTTTGSLYADNIRNCLDEDDSKTMANFTADDVHFMQVFASQAATAVSHGGFESPSSKCPETPSRWSGCFAGLIFGSTTRVKRSTSGVKSDLESERVQEVTPLWECKKAAFFASEEDVVDKTTASASLPALAQELLESSFDAWQLDTLALSEASMQRPLSSLGVFLFHKLGFVEHFQLDGQKLASFFEVIENGYNASNSYHNRAHAASVMHSMHALCHKVGLAEIAAKAFDTAASDDHLERMACLFAAATHDYEHPGVNNDFLVKTRNERAIRYNDKNVNEHHHCAAAFLVLSDPKNNFLADLPRPAFDRFRRLVIDLVLATDMADGETIRKRFMDALDAQSKENDSHQAPFVPKSSQEAILLLQVAMKCCDLGHLMLDWDLHVKWVRLLEQEFFAQGDQEKDLGLPVSFIMDREKPGASATQVGFFDFVVLPLFRALEKATSPKTEPLMLTLLDNYQKWKTGAALPG